MPLDLKFYYANGWVSDYDESSAANAIRSLIYAFGQDGSPSAADALASLLEKKKLSQWRTDILYAAANQIRSAREAQFRPPNVSQVVATLADAEPATVADLRALILEVLKEIALEIRHGNTDSSILESYFSLYVQAFHLK